MYDAALLRVAPVSTGSHPGSSSTHSWTWVIAALKLAMIAGDRATLRSTARMQHADHPEVGRDHRCVGEVELLGVGGAAVCLHPTRQRFLGGPADARSPVGDRCARRRSRGSRSGGGRSVTQGAGRSSAAGRCTGRRSDRRTCSGRGTSDRCRGASSRRCIRAPVPPVNDRWLSDSSWAPSWPTMSTLTWLSPRRPR